MNVILELGDEVNNGETCEVCGAEADYELFCDGVGGWFICGLHSIGIPSRSINASTGLIGDKA